MPESHRRGLVDGTYLHDRCRTGMRAVRPHEPLLRLPDSEHARALNDAGPPGRGRPASLLDGIQQEVPTSRADLVEGCIDIAYPAMGSGRLHSLLTRCGTTPGSPSP